MARFPNTLAGYIDSQSSFEVSGNVIACAARTPAVTPGLDSSVAVFFYPEEETYDYRIFLTDNVGNWSDHEAYKGQGFIDTDPVFGGKLRKFVLEGARREQWAIVSFVKHDQIHLSNPIRIKGAERPTEYSSDVVITGNGPTFCWDNGLHPDNAIYFQVITDPQGAFISGTYTFDKCYTHYQLDNVVLNITDPGADTDLEFAQWHHFTLMGVSEDNWVNLVIEQEFIAP